MKDQTTPETTTETKPPETSAETKPTDKPAETTAKPPEAGAPEKYEAFTVPEGFTLDEKVVGEANEIFKNLGLNQTQAQSLVDFYSAKIRETAEAPYKLYAETREKWQAEYKADPEIGNKLDVVKQTVSRALDSLGDPKLATSFREAMDITGAGDNPAFIRTFYKLAQLVTEGKPVAAGAPSKFGQSAPGAGPASAAKALYPDLP